jgi:AraC family transcriptional regulator
MAPWLGLRRTATPIKRKTERSGYRGFVLLRLKMDAVTATPVSRALWFIESHFGRELTLEEIADAGCVSRYHMSRVFAVTLGCPVMRYVRGRRLTQAARALVNGAPDILKVALDVGYGSHEGFTRAFREQFGMTPEAVRAQGNLKNVRVMEPMKMPEQLLESVEARTESRGVLLIAGLGARYGCESSAGIPAQWQKFVPHLGRIAGQVGRTAYGVMCNFDDDGNFDYTCGVEVADFSQVSTDWSRVRIPPQEYAVFTHRDHISTIRSTWATIWNQWLPESGREVGDAPNFELYGEDFDSVAGRGLVEIWLPLATPLTRGSV